MTEDKSGRFKDALWFPKEEVEVIVGGAGGIGSWLTLLLTRSGFSPIVFDFDSYEIHNMGGQLCKENSIGKTKVGALTEVVKDFTGVDIITFNEKYTEDSLAGPYMFSGFDNMQARKDMFTNWCKYVENWRGVCDGTVEVDEGDKENVIKNVPIFIDGRLAAEYMEVYCVRPDDIEKYSKTLFDDSEAEEAPCTMKQTSHAAAMIASKIVGFWTNHYANVLEGDEITNIPFYDEFSIPLNKHVNG